MRMYFRTDYYVDVGIDEVVRLQRGTTYEVVSETEFFYFIVTDNESFRKMLNIVMILKEDLEDDVYVVTGKSEEFEEGGGAI
jgi:hypothetical protein|uniref:Uncharacterized protein n=1 Tax=Siphoviridae sp. ctGa111 TaxID=2825413 RepID=A0A8S5VDJ6_9CAUD|nr:MAG TPA: hypothetical protein [Siphoviridae sp. ctGa111]